MIHRPQIFDPRKVPGGSVWLDASDAASMFQLSSGSTAVTADGDPVGYIANKFGGNNALQATTNNRPTYKVNIRNGRSVLRFDGANDSLSVASLTLDATFTIFIVASMDAAPAGTLFIEHGPNAGANSGFYFYGSANEMLYVRRTAAPAFSYDVNGVGSWAGTGWKIYSARATATASADTSLSVFTDRTQAANSTATTVGTLTGSRTITDTLNIFSRNGSSVFTDGDLGELLVWNRDLSDAERLYIRRGLASKWALAAAA